MQVITKTAAKFYGPHSGICLRPFSELNYRPSVGCPRHFPYNQFRRSFFCHRIGMTNEIILPVKVIGSIVPHSSIILIFLNDQRTTSPVQRFSFFIQVRTCHRFRTAHHYFVVTIQSFAAIVERHEEIIITRWRN